MLFLSSNVINSDSIDGVKIGMPIAEFLKISNERDTVKKEQIQQEGENYDIYNVYRNNKIVYVVEPDCGTDCNVWRIWIYGEDFKTKEDIGVGNTLADLKKTYTIKELSTEGEGRVAIFVNEINISFILDPNKIAESWWANQTIAGLNDELVIEMIIIA